MRVLVCARRCCSTPVQHSGTGRPAEFELAIERERDRVERARPEEEREKMSRSLDLLADCARPFREKPKVRRASSTARGALERSPSLTIE